MIYNVSMRFDNLCESEAASAVFDRFLPGMRQGMQGNSQVGALSIEQLVRYARLPQGEQILIGMEEALEALNTPENRISPSEAKQIERFLAIARTDAAHPVPEGTHRQDAIYPGQPWLDTKGERIQAHGGAVIYENGVYYWYGENKQHTDGKNGVWSWGIRVYASTDLYNWEDRGLLIPPVPDDPNAALYPAKRIDRPHILKCPQTGKYVCWIKLSGAEAAFTVWQADVLLGPYEMVENLYNPGGHKAGDFDLIADEDTGKGYLYFDADHTAMLCMELTGDYLHAEREVGRSYTGLTPPFTREGPALFARGGKKYMFTSGMTGYVPNQSDSAAADSWEDEFTSTGDPHMNDESRASFNSQISKVFKVEGRDGLFIAMADRWLPHYLLDAQRADLFTRAIASRYDPEHYQASDEERQKIAIAALPETSDTSQADYVWLPVLWENGLPRLSWCDHWTV